jgi:hypothetical protein
VKINTPRINGENQAKPKGLLSSGLIRFYNIMLLLFGIPLYLLENRWFGLSYPERD